MDAKSERPSGVLLTATSFALVVVSFNMSVLLVVECGPACNAIQKALTVVLVLFTLFAVRLYSLLEEKTSPKLPQDLYKPH